MLIILPYSLHTGLSIKINPYSQPVYRQSKTHVLGIHDEDNEVLKKSDLFKRLKGGFF